MPCISVAGIFYSFPWFCPVEYKGDSVSVAGGMTPDAKRGQYRHLRQSCLYGKTSPCEETGSQPKGKLGKRRGGWGGRSRRCKGRLVAKCLGVWLVEKKGREGGEKRTPSANFENGVLT